MFRILGFLKFSFTENGILHSTSVVTLGWSSAFAWQNPRFKGFWDLARKVLIESNPQRNDDPDKNGKKIPRRMVDGIGDDAK